MNFMLRKKRKMRKKEEKMHDDDWTQLIHHSTSQEKHYVCQSKRSSMNNVQKNFCIHFCALTDVILTLNYL